MQIPSAAPKIATNATDMAGQANALWKMLDEMAANDPEEYDRFLKSQMAGSQPAKKAEARTPLAADALPTAQL